MLALSCGTPQASDLELGVLEQPIFGGVTDTDELWPGVVLLRAKVGGRMEQTCTGTLVAPNLVISALHCVAPLSDSNFECNPDGSVTQLSPGAGELASPVAPEDVKVHVGLDAPISPMAAMGRVLVTTNSLNICNNDLALILLDTELDLPISRLRLDDGLVKGEPLTIVGYGTNSVSGESLTRRFVEKIRVTDLGSDVTGNTSTGAPPRTFAVGRSACKGDSGGPAFSQTEDGEPVVVGVDSIVIGSCGASTSSAVFTRLAPFKKIILGAFEKAGYPAWEEDQLEPGVDPVVAAPEAGVDDTSDGAAPVAQRLKTGCAVTGASDASQSHHLTAVVFVLALLFRRGTTRTSLR